MKKLRFDDKSVLPISEVNRISSKLSFQIGRTKRQKIFFTMKEISLGNYEIISLAKTPSYLLIFALITTF